MAQIFEGVKFLLKGAFTVVEGSAYFFKGVFTEGAAVLGFTAWTADKVKRIAGGSTPSVALPGS
jgi:hypothetical protein